MADEIAAVTARMLRDCGEVMYSPTDVPNERLWREETKTFARDLVYGDRSQQEFQFEALTVYMLSRTKQVTAAVFTAHPVGLSTTRSDLLHDLLP